ncbi:MAG TPA: aspartyl/asparaginyl beta-hydroxylase domain-containing protein [Rhodanobacteraceae bacterium]|nr:aspartyl/asparaginyl beta-hydroxylase domain-containing protein [Rhodanobacteraceae bacterium]
MRAKRVTLAGMTTDVAADEDPRVYEARGHAAQHHVDLAEALYREIIQTKPDLAEALNFIGMCELGRGELAAATGHLERAAAAASSEAEVWKNVGIVHLAQGHYGEALDAFDRALGIEPMHFATRLHRGAAYEQMGRLDDGAAAYFGAIATAQTRGKWINDVSTPPQLRPVVRHAIRFVDQHRKRIFHGWLAPLRERHGADALARMDRAVDIYLDALEPEHRDPHQQCTFLYVPDLDPAPVFPRERLPWAAALEGQLDAIRAELAEVLVQPVGMEPYLGSSDLARLRENHLLESLHGKGAWDAFFFDHHGQPETRNRARCPRTVAALDAVPLMRLAGHAPRTLLSIIRGGTHVLPRHGVANARLTTWLPLRVPADCTFSIDGVEQPLREGVCFSFDDTFEHEVCNRSDQPCIALSLDTWHPGLAGAEREAIAVLTREIGNFNRAARVNPPSPD